MNNFLSSAQGDRRLDRIDESRCHREAGLLRNLLEAGRAGDVDFVK
jgi:hypothetical protein